MSNTLSRFNLGLFNSGTYTPPTLNLSGVSQNSALIATTTVPHNYVVNQEVQFFIPPQWGMRQLNGLTGVVLAIVSPTQFQVNINTTTFDAFVVPTVTLPTVIDPAQVAGIGNFNYGSLAPGGVLGLPQTIPGAYENQPP